MPKEINTRGSIQHKEAPIAASPAAMVDETNERFLLLAESDIACSVN